MKTERRHELQTNTLADSLGHWIDRVKPYSRAVLAGVVLVAVAIVAWGYLSSQSAKRVAEGWTEYFNAMGLRDPSEKLNDIADNYAGTPVGTLARMTLADIQLDQGTNRLFANRKAGRDELQQAADKYRTIISEEGDPEMTQRAMFGRARAHEAMGTPLEQVRREYRELADTFPDSPYAKPALERAKALDTADAKGFYDWFAKYEPPRPMGREPGVPGVKPDFMKDPESTPTTTIPSAIGGGTTTLPNLGLDLPGDKPAGDAEKPAGDDAPSSETPSSETPGDAGDGKPADAPVEKPADAPPSDTPDASDEKKP